MRSPADALVAHRVCRGPSAPSAAARVRARRGRHHRGAGARDDPRGATRRAEAGAGESRPPRAGNVIICVIQSIQKDRLMRTSFGRLVVIGALLVWSCSSTTPPPLRNVDTPAPPT